MSKGEQIAQDLLTSPFLALHPAWLAQIAFVSFVLPDSMGLSGQIRL